MKQDTEWKGKYKSELLMVCHMDAKAMYDVGAITDKEMRDFDRDCLVAESEPIYETSHHRQLTPAFASPKSK